LSIVVGLWKNKTTKKENRRSQGLLSLKFFIGQ